MSTPTSATAFSVTVKNRLRPRLSRQVASRLGRDRSDPVVREIVAAGSTLVWLERQLREPDVLPAPPQTAPPQTALQPDRREAVPTEPEALPARPGRRLALVHAAALLHLSNRSRG